MRQHYYVYYALEFFDNDNFSVKNLPFTHRFIGEYHGSSLDNLFFLMQGENWSLNGKARLLIETCGLRHISMSVGDVIYDMIDNHFYKVTPIGFEILRGE